MLLSGVSNLNNMPVTGIYKMEIHLEPNPLITHMGFLLLKVDRSKNKYVIHNKYIYDLYYILYTVTYSTFCDGISIYRETLKSYGYIVWLFCDIDKTDIYTVYNGRKIYLNTYMPSMDNTQEETYRKYGLATRQYAGFPITNVCESHLLVGKTKEHIYIFPSYCPSHTVNDLIDGYIHVRIYKDMCHIEDSPSDLIYDTWVSKKGTICISGSILDTIISANMLDTRSIKQWKGFEDTYITYSH